jgi:hypothetical protein
LSASVKYSLANPPHCLLIFPTSWVPSEESTYSTISTSGFQRLFFLNLTIMFMCMRACLLLKKLLHLYLCRHFGTQTESQVIVLSPRTMTRSGGRWNSITFSVSSVHCSLISYFSSIKKWKAMHTR